MEQFNFALQVLVIGFLVVLVTLFMLYGILLLFSRLFYKEEKQVTGDQEVSLNKENSSVTVTGESDRKVIAAIMAAVNECLRQDDSSLKIASIAISADHAGNVASNNWKIIGRKALMENRIALEKIRRKRRIEKI